MPNRKTDSIAPARAWPLPMLNRKLLLIGGLALVLLCMFPFWGSVSVAAVFALGTYPIVRKIITRHGHGKPRLVVGACVALLTLLMLLPVTFFSIRIYNMATAPKGESGTGAFSSATVSKMASAKEKIESGLVNYGVKGKVFRSEEEGRESIRSGSNKIMTGLLGAFSTMLTSLPDIFLTLLVFCLFVYLFLSRGRQIRDQAIKLGIVPSAEIDRITKVLQASCYNSIVSNLFIGVIQASVVMAGARFGGYSEMVLIFTVVFFMSFIPFIGSAPVAFLLAGLSFLNHNTSSAIILIVTGMISGTIDNVIRPYLVANGENEVHPIVSFAAIIGAIAVLGFKGIFLGPVILTATIGLLNMPASARAAEKSTHAEKTKQAS